MKNFLNLIRLFCLPAVIALAGCGGGGSNNASVPVAPATKAIVRLSSQGTLPQGSQLSGIDVTITLPKGVSLKTDANGQVAAGVVTLSGVAVQSGTVATPVLSYTPATATTLATLRITFGTSNFGTGEFATINGDIAPVSSAPAATDVVIDNFSIADQNLAPVTTLGIARTMELR